MKKLLIGLAMTTSLTAQAQTSSTSASAAAPATATQTSTASVSALKPAEASKFGGTVLIQAYANAADVNQNSASAIIDSVNAVGLSYKITEKTKVEARHNFQLRSMSDNEQKPNQKEGPIQDYMGSLNSDNEKGDARYRTWEPTLHATYKSDVKVAGSAPVAFAGRYYFPVSGSIEGEKHSNGILRVQSSLDWDLNPKVALSMAAQLRLYMNTASNNTSETAKHQGSDSVLRYIVGPTATYNFSDALNVYYNPYFDMRTTDHSRGRFQKVNAGNALVQEVGVNYVIGPVTINPAFVTIASRGEGEVTYKGAGLDENTEYDLNVIAAF